MKKVQKIMILFAFILMFTACSKADDDDDDNKERKPREESWENDEHTEDKEKFVEIDKERYEAYVDVLEEIIEDNEWPDGEYVVESDDYTGNNQFAIFDVDLDGREELLVEITSNSTAGMNLRIFDYDADKDKLIEQEVTLPSVTFYDNGVIYEYASHNHTPSDVWPYSVATYDAKEDTYVYEGDVYAEDKVYCGDSFPSNQDKDKDGRIYYISKGNSNAKPSTEEEYKKWVDSYIKDAKELYIPWQSLWEYYVERIETAIDIEEVVLPVKLTPDVDIWNYDVTGDGLKDHIFISCEETYDDSYAPFGSNWSIEINGEKVHDFEWEDNICLEIELYQISDKRHYFAITECYEYNDEIGGYGLYQIKDGKLEQVCDFYDPIVKSIHEFYYGAEILYMTKEEMKVRAYNQFNATAHLKFDMIFQYKDNKWSTGTSEFDIYYEDYQDDKADGMIANQSFVVYTEIDCKKEAFQVEEGDVLELHSICIKDGAAYFKVTNEDGVEGWLPDPDEPYVYINGKYLQGYFEEAMFAG